MKAMDTAHPTIPAAGKPSQRELNRLFDDALDELEITYDTYYEIDRFRLRAVSVLGWLMNHGIRGGTALVLGPNIRPFTMVLEKCGFKVKGITGYPEAFDGNATESSGERSDVDALKDFNERFDVIVCDDLLQHLVDPVATLHRIRDRMADGGTFLLTTPNVARGTTRMRLLFGKNIYPELRDEGTRGSDPEGAARRECFYREYTLDEIKACMRKGELDPIYGRFIIGKKTIEPGIPLSISAYLFRKLNAFIQMVFPPLRSHLLVVAGKPSGAGHGDSK